MSHGRLFNPSAEAAWEKIIKKINRVEGIELTELEKKALLQTATIFDMRQSTNIESHRARYIKAFEKLVEQRTLERLTLPEVKRLVGKDRGLLETKSEKENQNNG